MHRRGFLRLSAALLLLSRGSHLRPARLRAQPPAQVSGRIFAATSFSDDVLPVYEITGGGRVPFARLRAGGWLGPLAAGADGRLLAVTNAEGGSLWDITGGGDLTGATPLASNLFPELGFLEGLAVAADGTAYIANGEHGSQPLAVVRPDGAVSSLPGTLENPRGLVIWADTLYAAEGSTGRVLGYDLAGGDPQVFATGFERSSSHTGGQFAADPRGRLLVLWATGGDHGLFDITDGGDFAGQPALVSAPFRIDVNQIAVDGANNVYAAGDGSGNVFVSRFRDGSFAPFEVFATDLGDTESVAVLP